MSFFGLKSVAMKVIPGVSRTFLSLSLYVYIYIANISTLYVIICKILGGPLLTSLLRVTHCAHHLLYRTSLKHNSLLC